MPDYDQRFIRRTDTGYKTIRVNTSICDTCGSSDDCFIKDILIADEPLRECSEYLPVIGFVNDIGLRAPIYNTFRKGKGVYNRLQLNGRVAVAVRGQQGVFGFGKVIERHQGPLRVMLQDHAIMNHMFLTHPERMNAVTGLQDTLIKLYGKNYAAPEETYSVVYVEPE